MYHHNINPQIIIMKWEERKGISKILQTLKSLVTALKKKTLSWWSTTFCFSLFTNPLDREQRCPQPTLELKGETTSSAPSAVQKENEPKRAVSELVRTQFPCRWQKLLRGRRGSKSRIRVGTVSESSISEACKTWTTEETVKRSQWKAVTSCNVPFQLQGRGEMFGVLSGFVLCFLFCVFFLAHQYDELSRPKPHSGSFQVCFFLCGIYWSRPKNQTNRTGMHSS